MDRILTIISEYNPFHLGHQYHLNESINETNPTYKIAIISGNFVQRGEPSLIDKWTKTKIALEAGFDIVIELPTIYALSSAENFALGAIKIANQLKTTYLSFGSENGNIEILENLTNLIEKNDKTFFTEIKTLISKGISYPKAQELAIQKLFGKKYSTLCTPNNILGFEYLKNLKKTKSKITPITIKRNNSFKSATEIREIISSNKSFRKLIPSFSFDKIENNENLVQSIKSFEKEIFYKLRTMSEKDLKMVPDIPENMYSKIKDASGSCNDISTLLEKLKNKSITAARIKRILLYILLDITKKDIEISKIVKPYIHVLGINKKSKKLLSDISKKNNVITSLKNFENQNTNKNIQRLLDIDKNASNVYTLAYKNNSKSNLDYTNKLITI